MSTRNVTHAKILVVEDSMADVVLIKHFFTSEKISNDISYAPSLSQARQALKAHDFDICFVDVSLPDGMGFDLVEDIDTENTSVIILSGSENMEHVIQAKCLGAVAYMAKPLNKNTLDRLVRELKQLHWAVVVDAN